MKKKVFFLITIYVLCFSSRINAQNNNSEKQIIEMLRKFYTEYNYIYSIKPPLTLQVLDSKLDSLMMKYCTSKLRKKAKKCLEDESDLLTNDFPGIHSFEIIKIEKDSTIENDYIVNYTTSNMNASRKLIKQKVVLHVSVVKENEKYLISNVK
ncbi:MAG: hypothetical protein WCL70_02070 [Paludibacter sp.]